MPAAFHAFTDSCTFFTVNPTWLTIEPTVPPFGGGVPAAWCKITSTPGNRTVSKFPPLTSVPPIARKIFLFSATSRLLRCQWAIVTPDSFGGEGCADAVPAEERQIR